MVRAIVNRRRVAGTGASRRRFGVPCEHGPSAYLIRITSVEGRSRRTFYGSTIDLERA
jgi:hypothetical protein